MDQAKDHAQTDGVELDAQGASSEMRMRRLTGSRLQLRPRVDHLTEPAARRLTAPHAPDRGRQLQPLVGQRDYESTARIWRKHGTRSQRADSRWTDACSGVGWGSRMASMTKPSCSSAAV